jgi:molybdenum cofactor synthesis domain-containing protein
MKTVTAALVIIGDEILSGRTQDLNINFLARGLAEIGINLREVRVVPDIEAEIIFAVNEVRKKFDYVFTSGGIGPTHDDITSESIAKAFGDKIIQNETAVSILITHYGKENLNDARLKMACVPSKAKLLENSVSSAPGFRIENVFVMAGIPKIFQAMFSAAKAELQSGKKVESREIKINLTESVIAKPFADLQKKYPQVIMGSYPHEEKQGEKSIWTTSLVFRGTELDLLEKAVEEMKKILEKLVVSRKS